MPNDYQENIHLLHGILHEGFEKLLVVAREKGILAAPYGRPPTPTPFVDDDDVDTFSDDNDNDDEDDFVEFKYEYGFNPLIYLADFIKKRHPATIAARNQYIMDCHNRLKMRAEHARRQIITAQVLRLTVKQLRCGILHGPITTPITKDSVLCICRAVSSGEVVIQVSTSPLFTSEETITFKSPVVVNEGDSVTPNRVVLSGLRPGTHYYVRCCLQDTGYYSIEERINYVKNLAQQSQQQEDNQSSSANTPTRGSTRRAGGGVSRLTSMRTSLTPTNLPPPPSVPPVDAPFLGRFRGVDEGCFRSGEFWTLPPFDPDADPGSSAFPFSLLVTSMASRDASSSPTPPPPTDSAAPRETFAVPASFLPGAGLGGWDGLSNAFGLPSNSTLIHRRPLYHCVLGDLLSHPPTSSDSSPSHDPHEQRLAYKRALWKLHQNSPGFKSSVEADIERGWVEGVGLMHRLGLLLAWNDSSVGSDMNLRAEEVLYKQYQSSLRKYERKLQKASRKAGHRSNSNVGLVIPALKVPVLTRPPIQPSVEVMSQEMPLVLKEDVARHFYRVIRMGPRVQVLQLDTRKGYLGRHQVKWVKETIANSPTTWSIVLAGVPLGFDLSSPARSKRDRSGVNTNTSNGVEISATEIPSSEIPNDTANIVSGVVPSDTTTGVLQIQVRDAEDAGGGEGEGDTEADHEGSLDLEAGGGDGNPLTDKGTLQYALLTLQSQYMSPAEEKALEETTVVTTTVNRGEDPDDDDFDRRSTRRSFILPPNMEPMMPIEDISDEADEDDDEADFDDISAMTKVTVDSGVIVLTSGLSHPFVATHDPCAWGTVFAVEVGVGNSVSTTGPEGVKTIDGLGSKLLYGEDGHLEAPRPPSGCEVKLRRDGQIFVTLFQMESLSLVAGNEDETLERDLGGVAVDGSIYPDRVSSADVTEGRDPLVLFQLLCAPPSRDLQPKAESEEQFVDPAAGHSVKTK